MPPEGSGISLRGVVASLSGPRPFLFRRASSVQIQGGGLDSKPIVPKVFLVTLSRLVTRCQSLVPRSSHNFLSIYFRDFLESAYGGK
jgi:hypothetical protein